MGGKFMVYGGGVILCTGDDRKAVEQWIEKDAKRRCEGYYTIFQKVASYRVASSAVRTS